MPSHRSLSQIVLGGAALLATGVAAQAVGLGSQSCILGAAAAGPVGSAIAALLGAASGFAGGWFSNRFHDRFKELEYQLNDPSDVLRNHFLRRLVTKAIELAIRAATDELGHRSGTGQILETLASKAIAHFEEGSRVAQALSLDEQQIVRFFVGEWDDFTAIDSPSREEWESFLRAAVGLDCGPFMENAIVVAAKYLESSFAKLLFNNAKVAAEHDRPAYAALELMLMRTLANTLARHGEQLDAILAAQSHTANELDSVKTSLAALRSDLASLPVRLETRLELPDLAMTPGLMPSLVSLRQAIPPAVASLDLRLMAIEGLLRAVMTAVTRANEGIDDANEQLSELRHIVAGDRQLIALLPTVGSVIRDHGNNDWVVERVLPGGRASCIAFARHRGRTSVFKMCALEDFARSFDRELEAAVALQGLDSPDARFCRILASRLPTPKAFRVEPAVSPPYWVQLEHFSLGSLAEYWSSTSNALGDRADRAVEIVAAIARTVELAHMRGIIHRDIKPTNILMRADGDTVQPFVADFGISSFSDPERSEALQEHAGGRTIQSKSLSAEAHHGTLLYMAPELYERSADNRPPAPPSRATDVYALGVMLYWLLTGRSEKPHPSRVREHVLDPTLSYLIRKATHSDSTSRHTSAADFAQQLINRKALAFDLDQLNDQLLTDVERLENEQFRREAAEQRRKAAEQRIRYLRFATSGLIAVILLIGYGLYREYRLRNRAEDAESRERLAALETKKAYEKRRVDLDAMLESFSTDQLKLQPGAHVVREMFLTQGLAQYQSMLADQQNDPVVLMRIAESHRELGILRTELGDFAQGLNDLRQSVDLARTSVKSDAPTIEQRTMLADALLQLAYACHQQNLQPEAAQSAEESVQLLHQLLTATPDNVHLKARLGAALTRLQIIDSDSEQAIERLERATALLEDALGAEPNNSAYLTDLGRTIAARGLHSAEAGDLANALDSYLKADAMLVRSIELNPANTPAHTLRDFTITRIATRLVAAKRSDEALRLVDDGLSAALRFASENPAIGAAQRTIGTLHTERAEVLASLGRHSDAIAAYDAALTSLEFQAERDPHRVDVNIAWVDGLASIHHLEMSRSRHAESMDALDRSIRRSDELMQRFPESADLKAALVQNYYLRAVAETNLRSADAAVLHHQQCIDFFKRYATDAADLPPSAIGNYIRSSSARARAFSKAGNQEGVIEVLTHPVQVGASLQGIDDREAWFEAMGLLAEAQVAHGELDSAARNYSNAIHEASVDLEAKPYYFSVRKTRLHHMGQLAALYQARGMLADEIRLCHDYLRERQWYDGTSFQTLIDDTQSIEAVSAERLRRVLAECRSTRDGRYTISVSIGGVRYPFHICITGTIATLDDQVRWVKTARGGDVPEEEIQGFRQFYELARKDEVPFRDLCMLVYGGGEDETRSERAQLIERVGELRRRHQINVADAGISDELVLALVQLAELYDTDESDELAQELVDEALASLKLDSGGHAANPDTFELLARLRFVQSNIAARNDRHQEAYDFLADGVRLLAAASPSKPVNTAQLRKLAEAAIHLDNLVEAAMWLWRAAESGDASCADELAALYVRAPASVAGLPFEFLEDLGRLDAHSDSEMERTAQDRFMTAWSDFQLHRDETLDPAEAVRARANALWNAHFQDHAVRLLQRAIANRPTEAVLIRSCAYYLAMLDRWKEAADLFRRVLECGGAPEGNDVPNYLQAVLIGVDPNRVEPEAERLGVLGDPLDPRDDAIRDRRRAVWGIIAVAQMVTGSDHFIALSRVRDCDSTSSSFWAWNDIEEWAKDRAVAAGKEEPFAELMTELRTIPRSETTVDDSDLTRMEVALRDKFVVMLLFGKNKDGAKIYSYLKINLLDLVRLKKAIRAGRGFTPSDYGELVAAGIGEPSAELRAEIARQYPTTD